MTSSELSSSTIPADIGKVAGPLLIGTFVNWGFLGVLSMQTYVYYLGSAIDSYWIKGIICFVYALEFTQTIMMSQVAFHSFAAGFGNLRQLDEFGLAWFAVPVLSGFVAFIAQSVYAYRVKVLSNSIALAGVIMLLAFLQLGGAVATGIDTKNAVLISNFFDKGTFITVGIWSGGSAVCDVIIAVCMTYYLMRIDTSIQQTNSVIRRLIRLIIGTGTLTAALATFNLIVSVLPNHPTYYQASSISLGKVYSISMLVVFNSRISFGLDRGPHARFEMPMVTIEFMQRRSSVDRLQPRHQSAELDMSSEKGRDPVTRVV